MRVHQEAPMELAMKMEKMILRANREAVSWWQEMVSLTNLSYASGCGRFFQSHLSSRGGLFALPRVFAV